MRGLVLMMVVLVGASQVYAQAHVKVWTRLAGTSNLEEGDAVAADPSGNCIIAGATRGGLFSGNAGRYDLFVAKYDPNGNRLWGRQRGTSERDFAYGVATDASGNIYATGYTGGPLDGQSHLGNWDIFLTKFDPNGNWLWTRQIGASQDDEGKAVTVDVPGNVYITGYVRGNLHGQTRVGTADVFICKYNSDGNRLWTRLFGSPEIDEAWAIACDAAGNVFVTGYASGGIEGNPYLANGDAFLAKYDTNGNRLWLRQWGTFNKDHGYSLATDTVGNIYLSGYTTGPLYAPPNGGREVFVAKFDPDGNELWGREFGSTPGVGTNEHDQGWGIAVGADGNVHVAGAVEGPLDGNEHLGWLDLFLAKYDPMGARLWTKQIGTEGNEWARGIATTADGAIFLTGTTNGNLDGITNLGGDDAFVMKFAPVTIVPPDLDQDGDVDHEDFSLFAACVSAPAVPLGEGCEGSDFDNDDDVDQSDFGILQRCYCGKNQLPDPNCADAS